MIAHHTATYPMHRDWDLYKPDPKLEPLVEIFQDRRGNYEYPEAPWEPGVGCPEQGKEQKIASGFVVEALKRGYKLGFCSGGDHMGLSMTGIPATSALTRENLFKAMKNRNCFGVSAPGVSVELHKAPDGRKYPGNSDYGGSIRGNKICGIDSRKFRNLPD